MFSTPSTVSLNTWNSQSADRLPTVGQISKDCMLVTADSRHLIVAALAPINEVGSRVNMTQRNNESLPTSGTLDDVRFYCIDLKVTLAGGG